MDGFVRTEGKGKGVRELESEGEGGRAQTRTANTCTSLRHASSRVELSKGLGFRV
jgi:hypothetical protein